MVTLFISRHTLVAGYYDVPSGGRPSVCPSVRSSEPFRTDNLSICSRISFQIWHTYWDEWYEIDNGPNPSIFNRNTALVHTVKTVSGVFFLYYL